MGTSGTTTTNVVENSVPEEFMPYYEDMLTEGAALTTEPYVPYDAQRIADPTENMELSNQMVQDIVSSDNTGLLAATDATTQNMSAAQGVAAQPGYEFSAYGYSDPTTFTGDAVSQYMDPYMQQVVDIQKAEATKDYEIAGQSRDAAAVQAGAYGGSRQQVAESMAEQDLMDQLVRIQMEGQSAAYGDAQNMFVSDRDAQMAAEAAAAAELARVQGSQSAEDLNRAQMSLDALGTSDASAAQLAALSEQARNQEVQNAQMLEALGLQEMNLSQAELDLAYEDFLRQQEYPMDQLQDMNALLNGLPVAAAGTQTTSVPYDPLQEALGGGIAAIGAVNALG